MLDRQKGSLRPMDHSLLPTLDPCGLAATQQRDPVFDALGRHAPKQEWDGGAPPGDEPAPGPAELRASLHSAASRQRSKRGSSRRDLLLEWAAPPDRRRKMRQSVRATSSYGWIGGNERGSFGTDSCRAGGGGLGAWRRKKRRWSPRSTGSAFYAIHS